MWKFVFQGLLAGLLASLAGVIYFNIYQGILLTEFDAVVNEGSIIGASIFGCMLIAVGQLIIARWNKPNLVGVFNLLVLVLSFASIIGAIGMTLPLDIDFPELFPGLVVPMHFFPALAYFALALFFKKEARV
jgi:uncharacterized membrane protein